MALQTQHQVSLASRDGEKGESVSGGPRWQTGPGLASEFKEAVSGKKQFLLIYLSLDLFQFHQFHRGFSLGWEHPSPQNYNTSQLEIRNTE